MSCWLLAALVAVGIAVEFCLIYFGAEVLTSTGLRTAQAAAAMSGFYLGILGSLADRVGLHAAFAIELVLIGVAALLLLAGSRLARPARGS